MRKQRLTLISMTVLLLFVTALLGLACEPGGFLVIENQRNEDLTIYVITVHENGVPPGEVRDYGVVPAHTTKQLASITFVKRSWVYRIEAVDPSGKVVFSHDYNWYDLEKIQPKLPPEGKLPRWNITIPP